VDPSVVLTVGASDSSGGSGIQADLRTLAAMRMHGASVVTAVVSRNTRGVTDVYPQPTTVVSAQLGSVLEDLPVAAVKTGMFPNAETAIAVAARARSGALPNLVVDPVLEGVGGSRKGLAAALERLLPHALVATPNREEASLLVGWEVVTPDDMAKAAAQQVPQLVELRLDVAEPLVLLLLGDLAGLQLGPQSVLVVHERRDLVDQRLLVHTCIMPAAVPTTAG
jgi:hydroxymethylpyrimidine kinase/phosphomethylpyrimidine kinase